MEQVNVTISGGDADVVNVSVDETEDTVTAIVGEGDTIEAVVVTDADTVISSLVESESTVVTMIPVAGPSGPPGPEGPQGPAGTGSNYTHVQLVPASVWVITHPLPFEPNVTVVDSAGTQIEGDVNYGTPGTVIVEFAFPFSGRAFLS